jgi:hypothetical protein
MTTVTIVAYPFHRFTDLVAHNLVDVIDTAIILLFISLILELVQSGLQWCCP